MTRVAILRCEKLPSFVTWEIPNLEELFEEDRLLIRGFQAQGLDAQPVVWNDPTIDWNQFDLALIRSTWDYLDQREMFLQVLSRIEASSCQLYNPLDAVRWSIDKHYLFDLQRWEIPIIPTRLISNIEPDSLHDLFSNGRPAQTFILKPTFGLGAANSYRVPFDQLPDALTTLKTSHTDQEYLIQPFLDNIISEGEWSFIFFNNQLSHVFLKKPAPNDYRVQSIYGGTLQVIDPKPSDLLQAESVMAKLPFDLLYARLDFVRVENQLSVVEIELIEPIFDFHLVPEGVERLVQATKWKLHRQS